MCKSRGILKDCSQWQSQHNTYKDIFYGLRRAVWCSTNCGSIPEISLCMLLGFSQRYWLRCRAGCSVVKRAFGRPRAMMYGCIRGRLCSEEAFSRPWAIMYRWMCGWLAGGPRWIMAANWCSWGVECRWEVFSAERCSSRSTRHRGRPFGHILFFLDVSELAIIVLMCSHLVVSVEWISHSQAKPIQTKVLTAGGDVPLSNSRSCFWPHSWAL